MRIPVRPSALLLHCGSAQVTEVRLRIWRLLLYGWHGIREYDLVRCGLRSRNGISIKPWRERARVRVESLHVHGLERLRDARRMLSQVHVQCEMIDSSAVPKVISAAVGARACAILYAFIFRSPERRPEIDGVSRTM